MLRWAIIFLIIAVILGVFGFSGAGIAYSAAKFLAILFVIIFLISLISGRRPPAV